MTLVLPRRRFLAGLVGLVAAPAVVKASSLMKIVAPKPLSSPLGVTFEDYQRYLDQRLALLGERIQKSIYERFMYGDPNDPNPFQGLLPTRALTQHSTVWRHEC